MAWEDHEELKPPEYRSDRYKLLYPEGYTEEQLVQAFRGQIRAYFKQKDEHTLKVLKQRIALYTQHAEQVEKTLVERYS